MHYVSKESSNKEFIWIRKMTSKEKKSNHQMEETNKMLIGKFQEKRLYTKRNTGYFLNRQIVCFQTKEEMHRQYECGIHVKFSRHCREYNLNVIKTI